MDTSGGAASGGTQQDQRQPSLPSGQVSPPDQAVQGAAVSQPVQPAVGRPFDYVRDKSAQGKPAGAKEVEFVGGKAPIAEQPTVVEVREPETIPEEVSGWLERAERDDVAEPPTIVHQGQVLVSPAQPAKAAVALPLDDTKIKQGLHSQLFDSIRWLAEWCVRVMKKVAGSK